MDITGPCRGPAVDMTALCDQFQDLLSDNGGGSLSTDQLQTLLRCATNDPVRAMHLYWESPFSQQSPPSSGLLQCRHQPETPVRSQLMHAQRVLRRPASTEQRGMLRSRLTAAGHAESDSAWTPAEFLEHPLARGDEDGVEDSPSFSHARVRK